MSEWGELCPKCNKGHLYPEGRRGIDGEIEGKLRDTARAMDLLCDVCGHKQKARKMTEYDKPPTEIVSGIVTKADPEEKLFTCDCGASFKTDQELFEHHQSEHGK
ncbi:MAG: hypothetical protein M3O68_02850 [Thermoproteota archaeon]|nr:hypothetical protein [Thermoproteota archaeon]